MDTNKIYAEHIANEYSKKETSKVNQLRKLDAKAKRFIIKGHFLLNLHRFVVLQQKMLDHL